MELIERFAVLYGGARLTVRTFNEGLELIESEGGALSKGDIVSMQIHPQLMNQLIQDPDHPKFVTDTSYFPTKFMGMDVVINPHQMLGLVNFLNAQGLIVYQFTGFRNNDDSRRTFRMVSPGFDRFPDTTFFSDDLTPTDGWRDFLKTKE
jgi:hypothetical protein